MSLAPSALVGLGAFAGPRREKDGSWWHTSAGTLPRSSEIILLVQKYEKSPTCCNFENSGPPTPTSSQIFKPIRKLVTNFFAIFRNFIT